MVFKPAFESGLGDVQVGAGQQLFGLFNAIIPDEFPGGAASEGVEFPVALGAADAQGLAQFGDAKSRGAQVLANGLKHLPEEFFFGVGFCSVARGRKRQVSVFLPEGLSEP